MHQAYTNSPKAPKQRGRMMCHILRGWPLAASLPWSPADPDWQLSLNRAVWFEICSNLCKDKQHRWVSITQVGRLSEHSQNLQAEVTYYEFQTFLI